MKRIEKELEKNWKLNKLGLMNLSQLSGFAHLNVDVTAE